MISFYCYCPQFVDQDGALREDIVQISWPGSSLGGGAVTETHPSPEAESWVFAPHRPRTLFLRGS